MIESHSNPRLYPAALSALLALLAYAITLPGTYVYDDMYIVREDPRVIEPGHFRELWTKDYNHGGVDNLYRPIVSTTYWLQWRLHGNRAWAFHLVNILLHAAVAAAVAEFARRLIGMRAAYLAGILFAVHPIHVEAVAGIVGRAESMCALAMLGAMILFMHRPMTRRRAISIGLCMIVAILSKEQGMILPFLLFALDRLRDWRTDRAAPAPLRTTSEKSAPAHFDLKARGPAVGVFPTPEKLARQILTLILCFSLSGYIVFREDILKLRFFWDRSFLDWTIQPMIRSTGSDRWLMPLVLLGHYTALLVAPIRLSIDYGGSAIGWTVDYADPYLYLGVATIALWIMMTIFAIAHRRGPLLFSLIALAMSYGVVGNVVTLIGTNFGERLMYLPSVFFLLAAASFAPRRQERQGRQEERQRKEFVFSSWRFWRPWRLGATLIAVLFTLRTTTYAWQWNDRLRLYEYSLARQPRSIRLYMLLADEQMKRNNLLAAERVDAAGRAEQPDYWDIYTQSAVVAEKLNKPRQADAFLVQAMRIRPSVLIAARRNELRGKFPELDRPATQPASRGADK